MKKSTYRNIGAVIFLLWVLLLLSGNVRFVPFDNPEALGYNIGSLILPTIGLALVYVGWEKATENTNSQDKAQETKDRP